MTKDNVSRRSFLQSTAAASAASALVASPGVVRGSNLNSVVRVGFVGVGGRCRAHMKAVSQMQADGRPVEAAAVCDVYSVNRDRAKDMIQGITGTEPWESGDFRELVDSDKLDAICVATPDHWHAKMTIDSMRAGKAVYCEKPMTHTIQESQDVVKAWNETGQVMQVGVQSTSDPRWKAANQFIREGHIGKVVQAQTEYYRNSGMGQWRYYGLAPEMTPKNIDWKMFLGTEFGLAPEIPFDRAVFGQWRCYWPFGSGLYTDLFVHRLTRTCIALGVKYPRRVVGGGGIFLEYDGRDVPDTATVVADYDEGLQILVTATMVNDHPIEQCIRGHHGTVSFNTPNGFDFIPQRPQVTRTSKPVEMHIEAPTVKNETVAHWENFLDAIAKNDQQACNNPPDLGAAAITTITMGAESYRTGKVFEWDKEAGKVIDSGPSYAAQWEAMSKNRAAPHHIPGWDPYDKDEMFSRQKPEDYQALEGPWTNGKTDPAQ